MTPPEGARQELVEHYFRHEYGRLVGILSRTFGLHRLAQVEDAVQTALLAALTTWTRSGIPREPAAWLLQVARNRMLDELRHERIATRTSETANPAPATTAAVEPTFVDEIADDLLRMLFVCSDESLPRESQLVLALKIVCGFGVREIALRLMTTEANVRKRLARGRERLARQMGTTRPADIDTPPREALERRLDAVLQTIYLIFTGGYSSTQPDRLVRRELCDEAVRLGLLLTAHSIGDRPAAWALLALMYMHIARLETRVDGAGGLLLLEEQDRSRWDTRLIHHGLHCLARSASGTVFTRYHAEAAVLAEHCMAPSFAETRWDEIVSLYEILERLAPSPVYTLNRAIAVAERDGPEAGLAILYAIKPPTWLLGYYLWDATLGELERRAGRHARAVAHLTRALDTAPTDAEKALIRRRLASVDAHSREGD